MRASRFTEQQVVAALRQAENGTPVGAGALWAACRKLGVSEQPFYRWKRKYAGIGGVNLRRLRQVEDEHRSRKQQVARVPARRVA
jgi:putative transposase